MRQVVAIPQAVVDEHALVAQTYASYLVGHPVRAARYTTPLPGSVDVDWSKPWVEPNPMPDGCVFCARLSDEEAERRVAGFQYAIDKEVLASKWTYLNEWVGTAPPEDIPVYYEDGTIDMEQTDGSVKSVPKRDIHSMALHPKNRRRFIEINQYIPREEGEPHSAHWGTGATKREARPKGWKTKAAPIVSLPMRIKRKLCIDWNHVYARWMKAEGLSYDFDTHEFYRDVPDTSSDFDMTPYLGGL